jgi:hypothetical protein
VHILTAIMEMETALLAEEAPQRQLDAVRAWQMDVIAAALAANACGSTTGLNLDTMPEPRGSGRRGWKWSPQTEFVTGVRTHRAWKKLCELIISALLAQETEAESLRSAAMAQARAATTEDARATALARARKAAAWKESAFHAEIAGRVLVEHEDAIVRPVGLAIAAAGGISEVAKDKHYHQGRGRR